MHEPEPRRESDQPGASNSEFLVAGIVGGVVILLIALLFALFGVFHSECDCDLASPQHAGRC